MLPLVVEVRDRNLARVGVLAEEDLTDLQLFPARNDVGTWALTLPHLVRDESGAWVRHRLCEYLATPGSGIVVTLPGGRRFSGPTVTPSFEASTSNPGGTWTFSGVSDLIVLDDRAAFPDPTQADAQASSQASPYDVRVGKAETIMRAYVSANIGPSAPAARRDARITLAGDLGRGSTRTKSVRFKSLLALCQEIATTDGLLFDLVQVGSSLEFQVSTPSDLSGSVRMDIESDQLAATKFAYSAPGATSVIVMGQGEGSDRVIRTRTTTESTASSAEWGRVIERVVDQRQTAVVAEIDAKGDEVLATEGVEIQSVNVTPSEQNARDLGLKWWLGDVVTVNVAGVPVQAAITNIRVAVSSDGIYAGATVGDAVGFDPDRVTTARVGSVEGRVSSLERTSEAATTLAWGSISGKPTTFAPAAHGHTYADLSGTAPFYTKAEVDVTAQHRISPPSATARPDSYPLGASVSSVGSGAWPVAYATVLTVRDSDFRQSQIITEKATGRTWTRSSSDGATWGSFVELAAVADVPQGVPSGTISMFGGSSAPSGYLLCDGSAVSRTTYAALYAAIGTTYGTGNGSTTFTLPNLKGRVPVGLDSSQAEFNALGETGGAKTHTLTEAEIAVHRHWDSGHSHRQYVTANAGGTGLRTDYTSENGQAGIYDQGINTGVAYANIGTAGGGGAHNNLQPYIALNYTIKT